MGLIRGDVCSLGLEVVVVVSLASVSNCLFFSSLLSSKSKANGHDSVCVGRIAPSGVLVNLWGLLTWVHLGGEDRLVRALLLIRCTSSFLSNLICCCLHDFVDTEIQIKVVLVNSQRLAVVDAR